MKRGIVSGYTVEFPDLETGTSLRNNYGGDRESRGKSDDDMGNHPTIGKSERVKVQESRPSTGKKGKNIGNMEV